MDNHPKSDAVKLPSKEAMVQMFETVYAARNPEQLPWAHMGEHPGIRLWREHNPTAALLEGKGKRALIVGCGLGDDAEGFAALGYHVTAFDISTHAIEWCRERFPTSSVDYRTADLLAPPPAWHQAFDLVLEVFTIQALPIGIRAQVIANIADFVAPSGTVLVVALAREEETELGMPPWPLSPSELREFETAGLTCTQQVFHKKGHRDRLLSVSEYARPPAPDTTTKP